eukprot:550339_1
MHKGNIGSVENSVVLMSSGSTQDFEYYDSVMEKCVFRQELWQIKKKMRAFFRYLVGINGPDLVGLLDLARRRVIRPGTRNDSALIRLRSPTTASRSCWICTS